MAKINTGGLTQDLVFEVLKSPRRRYVLYYLRKNGGWVDLSEVTEQVAAWENDTTIEGLESEQRKRVYISLYQTHLPKLDEAGVVEYDQTRGVIRLADRANELDDYLSDQSSESVPWDKYYLGLSVLSGLLVVGVWAGVPPLASLSELMTAFLILAVFTVFAVTQHFHTTQRKSNELPPELSRTKT